MSFPFVDEFPSSSHRSDAQVMLRKRFRFIFLSFTFRVVNAYSIIIQGARGDILGLLAIITSYNLFGMCIKNFSDVALQFKKVKKYRVVL